MIYFIRAGESDHVKIGWTRDDKTLKSRINSLQTGQPIQLVVIRTIDAPRWAETWLHGFYSGIRAKGEWFGFRQDMLTIEPPPEEPGSQRIIKTYPEFGQDIRLRIPGRIYIPFPQEIEILADEVGMTIAQACAKAGLTRDVFTRWKRGVGKGGIGVENLRKIVDQLELAISDSAK